MTDDRQATPRRTARPTAPTFEVGVRRAPELDPGAPLPESDPNLVARMTAEIRRDGPMTFARFMELALYDADAGYYTARPEAGKAGAGPGRGADFLTAPESHPLFGWAIARHLESVWAALGRPEPFVVREHGAGTGALAEGILDGLRRSRSDLQAAIRYQPVDASPARVAALHARLDAAGHVASLAPFEETAAVGAILANELLDALPVHRVEGGPGGTLLERFVALSEDGELVETVATPSTPALADRLAGEDVQLAPGQVAEVCLALDGWVATVAAQLERGELLLIDYGHPAPELYRAERGSTLRAYHRHRVHADPFVAIGRQDLTAHVDLTAVERAARAARLTLLGRTTQARFLAALEAGELLVGLQSEPGVDLAGYLEARSALVRMLDSRASGGFAVLAFGRGLETGSVRGFS
jgi:SAM-dependent MidA family methyltransferase